MSYKYSIPRRQIEDHIYTQEELYREYHPIILQLLIKKKKPIMDAEDIAHDVFVKILSRWDRFEDWHNLENYLSWMVNNCVVNFYKKFTIDANITSGSETVDLIDQGFISDPLTHYLKIDFRESLQLAFETLSKTERTLFYGFYIEDKKVEELRQGRTVGATLNMLFRARTKVSAFFKKQDKDD